ncbi:hypothetical protein [Amycolatopsis sp. NPDC051903]|uniref:hypothetical protein n=1 Tax=Amycolatopsis sp. NPDC051903 TaxID=3363936 RepID=UPI0037880769
MRDSEGRLRNPGSYGKPHVATGAPIRLPVAGTPHVRQPVIDQHGLVKDLGGYVEPD